MSRQPGATRRQRDGWLAANRWLLARRVCQFAILGLFLLGPLAGIAVIDGNLAGSRVFGQLVLADPYVVLQSVFAGHVPAGGALTGAVIVLGFYLLAGGRAYCAWVCPINIITDFAGWLRRRLGLDTAGMRFSAVARYGLLALTLVLALLTGSIVWELVNPVSMLYRGLLFGIGSGWLVVLAVLLFDLLVSRRGWCGHVCPVGAFYSIVGRGALVRIAAARREACNDCMECFAVCPEPQVIRPALKGSDGASRVIRSGNCTNCARCIDVCTQGVYRMAPRFLPATDTVQALETRS